MDELKLFLSLTLCHLRMCEMVVVVKAWKWLKLIGRFDGLAVNTEKK